MRQNTGSCRYYSSTGFQIAGLVLLAMEAKLSELCGLIQQRDAEIAALRQTVTHECATRTHLLASIKRSSRG